MKNHKFLWHLSFSLFVITLAACFNPHTAFSQSERLGIVKYTPPKGWNKTETEGVIGFSKENRTTGEFCIITLRAATASEGDPQKDFKREWNNLVVKPLQAEVNPKTETELAEGWTIIAGGGGVEIQGATSAVFLTVYSGFGKTVSMLGVLNDQTCLTQLEAFGSGIRLDKPPADNASAPAESTTPAPAASAGRMHIAALVREFELNEVRANQVWIGKRVRVYGTVNRIEVERDGSIVLDFKSSISTYNTGRCFINKSQSAKVAELSAHQEATVEGTVRGLGGGIGNTKAFLLLESCIVP